MTAEKPFPGAAVAAFEKVPFENDSSVLWKHVRARRFRFVYHYHPEIELIHFVDGDGVEFVGDSSQTFKAGHRFCWAATCRTFGSTTPSASTLKRA